METVDRRTITSTDIVAQAADVATAAVRTMLATALRSATTCRCNSCRTAAATTYDWATAYLRAEPARLSPPRLPFLSGPNL